MQKSTRNLITLMMLMIFALAVISACDAVMAPDDLDITPTATATLPPTATPSPTPLPEGATDPLADAQEQLDLILENIPNQLPAGAIQWRRNYEAFDSVDGIGELLRIDNGVGNKIFFNEQTGGQMNVTYAFFDSPESAEAHYEFIKGIRRQLDTGDSDDSFPGQSLFGQNSGAAVAIIQVDNTFIEVFIEAFSSTQGSPLKPLARAALRYHDDTLGITRE